MYSQGTFPVNQVGRYSRGNGHLFWLMAGAVSTNLEFTENEEAINTSTGKLRILLSSVALYPKIKWGFNWRPTSSPDFVPS